MEWLEEVFFNFQVLSSLAEKEPVYIHHSVDKFCKGFCDKFKAFIIILLFSQGCTYIWQMVFKKE